MYQSYLTYPINNIILHKMLKKPDYLSILQSHQHALGTALFVVSQMFSSVKHVVLYTKCR